jgi:hypothetical protein
MATLREYFDTDFSKYLSLQADWPLNAANGDTHLPISAKIVQDIDANAKYWAFFVPAGPPVSSCLHALFRMSQLQHCVLTPEGDGIEITLGYAWDSEIASSSTLVFTRRILLYIDSVLTAEDRQQIVSLGDRHGYLVQVRDKEFALNRADSEKPLAFISHDSRDKSGLVRELAVELSKLMCPVWYDEYSLKVGDSLRASIEKGLREAKKCIVILSPHFLENGGWGKAEFDSIYTREIMEKSNVMLPVWHNVNANEVYEYSPRLVDKFSLNSSVGVKELARKLAEAVRKLN